MKNTQSGVFFLLSILFFIRYLRAKNLGGQTGSGWAYALTLIFGALAMASKSSTVILPVVLCLCAWWLEGRWHWRNLTRVVPLFLMAIAAGTVSIWTQSAQLAILADPRWQRTWLERLAAAGDAVWFYLFELLWPHPLISVYPRWRIATGQWGSYLGVVATVVSFVHFLAQTSVLVARLFFCLCVFFGGLTAWVGVNRQHDFSDFFGL
jgi:hypothetical protein